MTGRRHPRFEYYLNADMERSVVAEARWHLAGYALIAALSIWSGSWAAITMWLAPMLAMSWTHQIQNIIEHTGMPFTSDTWTNTRTVRTNPLMRWLAWQMVYHTAHHTYPGVPFHRLATLHRAIIEARGEEPVTSTYLEQFARTLSEPFQRPPDGAGHPLSRRRPERGGQGHAHQWCTTLSGGRRTLRLCQAHCHPLRRCSRRHRDGSRPLRDGEAKGAFVLSWCAHGLAYGVPREISKALEEGRCVIANVSRGVIAEARENFPRVASSMSMPRPHC